MNRQDVDTAAEALRSLFPATPLQLNEHLSARYNASIYLKREDLSPVRSYKIRGAFNFFRKVIDAGGDRQAPLSAHRPATMRRALLLSAATSLCRAWFSCR